MRLEAQHPRFPFPKEGSCKSFLDIWGSEAPGEDGEPTRGSPEACKKERVGPSCFIAQPPNPVHRPEVARPRHLGVEPSMQGTRQLSLPLAVILIEPGNSYD